MASSSGLSPLEESQRLMRELEENQTALEQRIRDSKKRLAHSDALLRTLNEILNAPR
jgi:hypothetical protein